MKKLFTLLLAVVLVLSGFKGTGNRVRAEEKINKIDGRMLEKVFDDYYGEQGKRTFTGAAVAVVQNGEVLFVRGYGYEDPQRKVPVDPRATRFRVGSVTKTLVGTAVAKLYSEGRIQSLDDPVNKYLKTLSVPKNGKDEITIRMLATHQAGFAENPQHFILKGDVPERLTGSYFKKRMPEYIVPVNSGSIYSNYGIDLLAFMVSEIVGMPFEKYVQQSIFDKAGMKGAALPRTPEKLPHLSDAQSFYPDGTTVHVPSEWAQAPVNMAAGGLIMTAEDASRYMLGLLGGSKPLDVPALVEGKGRDIILNRQAEANKVVQGFSTVFMHSYWNGNLIFGHDGNTLGTNSVLFMLPEHNIGVFLTVSSQSGTANPLFELLGVTPSAKERTGPRQELPMKWAFSTRNIFLDALLGEYKPPISLERDKKVNLKEYLGDYVTQRREIRTVNLWFSQIFFKPNRQVREDGKGGLIIGGRPGYIPVGKDVFYRGDKGTDLYAFKRDQSGKVVSMSAFYSDTIFKKVSPLMSPFKMMNLLLAAILIFFTGLFTFYWPKKMKGKVLAPVTFVLLILLPITFFMFFPRVGNEALSFVARTEEGFIPFQVMSNITAVLAAAIIYNAAGMFFRDRNSSNQAITVSTRIARLHLILLAVGSVLLIWAFLNLGLIGWNVY